MSLVFVTPEDWNWLNKRINACLQSPLTQNISIHNGYDIIWYSDAGVTEKARIDGATGNITTVGTIDSVDVSALAPHALNSATYHSGDLDYSQLDAIVATTGGGTSSTLSRADHIHSAADGSSKVNHANLDNVLSDQHHVRYADSEAKAACVSDAVYGVGWDGVTDIAPSKNAVYDKLQSLPTMHSHGAGAGIISKIGPETASTSSSTYSTFGILAFRNDGGFYNRARIHFYGYVSASGVVGRLRTLSVTATYGIRTTGDAYSFMNVTPYTYYVTAPITIDASDYGLDCQYSLSPGGDAGTIYVGYCLVELYVV